MALRWRRNANKQSDDGATGDPSCDTFDLLNREVSARLDRQTQATDRVDTKVTVVVGLVLTGIPIVATRHLYVPLEIAAFVCATVSIGFGLWCLRPRDFLDVPSPGQLIKAYRNTDYLRIVGALIGSRVDAFTKNEKHRKAKVLWWRCSLVALVLAGFLATAAVTIGARK